MPWAGITICRWARMYWPETRRTEIKLCVTIVRWPCEPHQPSLSVDRVAGGVCAA